MSFMSFMILTTWYPIDIVPQQDELEIERRIVSKYIFVLFTDGCSREFFFHLVVVVFSQMTFLLLYAWYNHRTGGFGRKGTMLDAAFCRALQFLNAEMMSCYAELIHPKKCQLTHTFLAPPIRRARGH